MRYNSMADKETIRQVSKKWDEDPIVNVCPCTTCVHYIISDKKKFTCKAYPDGIPEVILRGEVDHREPHPGDHGIQYLKEPIDLEFEKFYRKLTGRDKKS